MATGHTLIPLTEEELNDEAFIEYLQLHHLFLPPTLPQGRFPTRQELRKMILGLGYKLEETQDWYVTSDQDHTEIWFSEDNPTEDMPISFWFRRGQEIVFELAQVIANQCGSQIVLHQLGSHALLFLSDTNFSTQTPALAGFSTAMEYRLPIYLDYLKQATIDETKIILSQIYQFLLYGDRSTQDKLNHTLTQAISSFSRLLISEDKDIRILVFQVINKIQINPIDRTQLLKQLLEQEQVAEIKVQMILELEAYLLKIPNFEQPNLITEPLLNLLDQFATHDQENASVRLVSAIVLVKSYAYAYKSAWGEILVAALVNPDQYENRLLAISWIISQILQSLDAILLADRIAILKTALPQIRFAQDAHEVLRSLLDHTFLGRIYATSMTGTVAPPPTPALQPYFRPEERHRGRHYPPYRTQRAVTELLPHQREILEFVIDLPIPWMFQSNILEKYGLPSTPEAVRTWLQANHSN